MSDTPRQVLLERAKLHLSARVQARAVLPPEAIERYTEALRAGAEFPPLTVFYDGVLHYVADGFLRAEAYKRVGRSHVLCEIRPGSLREARLYAASCNARHGEPRTLADRRRSVLLALEDETAAGWPNAQLAHHCGVSASLVAGVRRLVAERNEQQRREAGERPSTPPPPACAAARSAAPQPARSAAPSDAADGRDTDDVRTRLYRTLRRAERFAKRLGMSLEDAVARWRADAADVTPATTKGPARAG